MSLALTVHTLSKLFPLAVIGIVVVGVVTLFRTFRHGAYYWEQFLPEPFDTQLHRRRKLQRRVAAFVRVVGYCLAFGLVSLLEFSWLLSPFSDHTVLAWLFLLTFPLVAVVVYGILIRNAAKALLRWNRSAYTFRRRILRIRPAQPTLPTVQPGIQVIYLLLGMVGIVLSISWYLVHYPWLLTIYASCVFLMFALIAGAATRGKRSADNP
jgi:hypothetical protein